MSRNTAVEIPVHVHNADLGIRDSGPSENGIPASGLSSKRVVRDSPIASPISGLFLSRTLMIPPLARE